MLYLPTANKLNIETSLDITENWDQGASSVTEGCKAFPSTSSTTQGLDYQEPSTSKFSRIADITRSKHSFLQDIGVTRALDLTPKARKLYKKVSRLNKSVQLLRRRGALFRKKMKLNPEELIDRVTSSLNHAAAVFVRSQINLANKTLQGRRYTLDDKILALVLQKQSGKAYRALSKMFGLPSKKTLMTLLRHIPIGSGINEPIFDNLRANIRLLQPRDKICTLIFDEMELEPHVDFSTHLSQFEGFEDFGSQQSGQIADHVQVFMLKGITKSWKQPIAYHFCRSTTKTIDLVRILKTIIRECHNADLKVIATVSDQGATNSAAINYLIKYSGCKVNCYSDLKKFELDGQEIVHIFDPPHLLKGIRNNLLTKDLMWQYEDTEYTAKWAHIIKSYQIDNSSGDLRAMPKLTDSHVMPGKIKKMKVSYAAQVFSHTVSSVMTLLTQVCRRDGNTHLNLEGEAAETAKILKFFDGLFDSVNGSTLFSQHSKNLKCAVSLTSGHVEYWRDARMHLKNMHFINPITNQKYRPPSLKNWVATLAGMEYIMTKLQSMDVTFFRPRFINQDALENFFGQIRQHGGRNSNPTVHHFKGYFKTLLINNFVTRHSVSANCEADESFNIISSVKRFVTQGVPEEECSYEEISELVDIVIPPRDSSYITEITIGYVSGFISKKIKTIRDCSICRNNILSEDESRWHDLCRAKEYIGTVPHKLRYCTPQFIETFAQIHHMCKYIIPVICMKKNSFNILTDYLTKHIEFNFESCQHTDDLKNILVKYVTAFCCHNWASGINRVLAGKESRKLIKDNIYSQALEYRLKRKRF